MHLPKFNIYSAMVGFCVPALLLFLWATRTPSETVILVPHGYDGHTELTVVVWLHGYACAPTDKEVVFQKLADKHQIGFIGVSGTDSLRDMRYGWADDVQADFQRIRRALAEAHKRMRLARGRAVALGFSQGGTVGIEAVVRHPEIFAGAISISAGTGEALQLEAVADRSGLPRQGFVIVCGAKEAEVSVRRSDELAAWLTTNKANVLRPDYPEHSAHTFPSDYLERLPEWLAFIERARRQSHAPAP